MKKIVAFAWLMLFGLLCRAENWDDVKASGEYYYGEGTAATREEADRLAWAEMLNSIVVHVSNDFQMLYDETNVNGKVDSKSKVMDCIKTYSQGTFTNVETMSRGEAPKITVLRYMRRSELEKIYAHRIEAAREWVRTADASLATGKVDMALQYYYWAYALVRSLQRPYEVKDAQGRALATELPLRVREILGKIEVKYDTQEDELVNLLFYYDGKPVSRLNYTYNDGQSECEGNQAMDGRGSLEMAPGYRDKKFYDVRIEYENKGVARGDAELQSVLNVVPLVVFPEATHKVLRDKDVQVASQAGKSGEGTASGGIGSESGLAERKVAGQPSRDQAGQAEPREAASQVDAPLEPTVAQSPEQTDRYATAMKRIEEAFRTRNYNAVIDLFDIEGLSIFHQVTSYGTPHLVGEQHITFFKGAAGTVTARGLKLAFSFTSPKKATFTENLVFTFNKEGKICNVTFGLGRVAENDILCRNVDWGEEVKSQILEFMENYKTAYCLKRLDYIKEIFADDAVIIVGRVVRKAGGTTMIGEKEVTNYGRDIITRNRYTKNEYLKHLEKCFYHPRNKYINVKFAENDVQSLKSFQDNKVYGIQIKQLYNSATYGDVGYLFLMVDMTDPEKPQIKVRTWQPNETPMYQLYNSGDFYR